MNLTILCFYLCITVGRWITRRLILGDRLCPTLSREARYIIVNKQGECKGVRLVNKLDNLEKKHNTLQELYSKEY